SRDWLCTGESAVCWALPPKPLQKAALSRVRSSRVSRRKRTAGRRRPWCGLAGRREEAGSRKAGRDVRTMVEVSLEKGANGGATLQAALPRQKPGRGRPARPGRFRRRFG